MSSKKDITLGCPRQWPSGPEPTLGNRTRLLPSQALVQSEAPRERRPHSRHPSSTHLRGTTPSSRKINGPGVPVEALLSTKTAALGPRGPAEPGSKPSRQGLESSPSSRAHAGRLQPGVSRQPLSNQGGTPLPASPSPPAHSPAQTSPIGLLSSTQAAVRPQPGLTGEEEGR